MKVWHLALIFGKLKASQPIIESYVSQLQLSPNRDRYSPHTWVYVHAYQHVELIKKTLMVMIAHMTDY